MSGYSSSFPATCDLAIAGAGLAGGLIALALAEARPDVRVLLVDAADHAGGNHVWSFFDSDVNDAARALLAPMVAHRWEGGHDVHFPGYDRHLASPYNSMTSTLLDAHLRGRLGDGLLLDRRIADVLPDAILLDDGTRIAAKGVIDARGLSHKDLYKAGIACGWQKFVGQTLRLASPHGLTNPVIMDATVDQADGYRFVYLLPVGDRQIFVEDTYYTDGPELDHDVIRARIAAYATDRGWTVEAVEHEECGVLPVVKGGGFESLWPVEDPVAWAGTRAGLFHHTTSYSVPMAAEFALNLARSDRLEGSALAEDTRRWASAHWRACGYYRLLDTMLFDAAPPAERYRIFERFYRLPEPLIARFYAGRSSAADKIRILCGRPPVRIRAAMQALMKRKRA
ncbi:MAG: lycopene beta-cyclase CrtY [Sphingobium sp.]